MNFIQSIIYRLYIITWQSIRSGIKLFSMVFPDVLFSFPIRQNEIALTIDDSPNRTSTMETLEILRRWNVKATFFVIGSKMEDEEGMSLAQRIIEEGHELGNHSYYEKETKGEDTTFLSHVIATDMLIDRAYERSGIQRPNHRWYRPPSGRFSYASIESLKKICHIMVMGSLYAYDWKFQDPKKNAEFIIDNSKPGDILVLHDLLQVPQILQFILPGMIQNGYRFHTLSYMATETKTETEAERKKKKNEMVDGSREILSSYLHPMIYMSENNNHRTSD